MTAAELRRMTARASVCKCGRRFHEHGRITRDGGNREYVCGLIEAGRFTSATLPAFEYDPDRGLVIHDPDPEPALG